MAAPVAQMVECPLDYEREVAGSMPARSAKDRGIIDRLELPREGQLLGGLAQLDRATEF